MSRNCWVLSGFVVLGLLFAGGCQVPGRPGKPAVEKPIIVAHYMTWFGLPERSGAWYQWKFALDGFPPETHHDPDFFLPDGRRDIAATHYPVIGPYDSTDPDALEYHILLAKAAGIDAFMVNWYGFEDRDGKRRHEDAGFEQLLRVAERLDFKVCVNLDDKCAFGGYRPCPTRQSAVDFAQATLLRVMTNYAASPAYLRIKGRPVFSNFGSMYADGKSLDQTSFATFEWDAIIRSLAPYKPFFIHDHQWHWKKTVEQAGFLSSAASVFPWVGSKYDRDAFYDECRALHTRGKLEMIMGMANCGFDNTPCQGWGFGIFQLPRRDGAEFREQFEESVSAGAGFIQLITWNDHTEGSSIEPTYEFGDQYLQITAEFANRFAPGSDYGTCLDLPHRIYDLRKQ
ncbi:MAG TPA: endo-1,3-alpha-glucanase family glycosylhydrolase, partial [Kiritimatiellia bacterium]